MSSDFPMDENWKEFFRNLVALGGIQAVQASHEKRLDLLEAEQKYIKSETNNELTGIREQVHEGDKAVLDEVAKLGDTLHSRVSDTKNYLTRLILGTFFAAIFAYVLGKVFGLH